ncbi:MAG: phospholipid-binding lipoprotein MlaA [Candidatus Endobugula sp.]|jgi:phospholipid-binding lipoprotein MlaA
MTIRLLLLPLLFSLLSACAFTPEGKGQDQYAHAIDPYEGFNRKVYGFNNGVDNLLLKPAAQGYRFVMPDVVETGVSNFFSNLLEVRNILNSLLQGKGEKAANSTGRFIFNSTIGLAGLFDVAGGLGLEKQEGEDFGQTLGAWGVESGSYLVLPLLGPSTFRDGLGIPVDMYVDPINYHDQSSVRTGLTVLKVIDVRAGLLEAEKLMSGDKYVFMRDAYLQRREYLVKDGKIEDTFGGEININSDF